MPKQKLTAQVAPDAQVFHGSDGVRFSITIPSLKQNQHIDIVIPTEQATSLAERITKTAAAIEVMKERYKKGQESFAIVPAADALDELTEEGMSEPIIIECASCGEICECEKRQQEL